MDELVGLRIRADMRSDTDCNMTVTSALVQLQVQNYLVNNYFDVSLCHGDRFETLGFAVACSFANVPLVHMEAGELSGNVDNKIRWAITSLADLHLSPSWNSNFALKDFIGEHRFVGSPAVEYILRNKKMFFKRWSKRYILVVYNPTDSKELGVLLKFLDIVQEDVVWINPNIDPGNKGIVRKVRRFEETHKNVKFEKNLTMDDYLTRMANCKCLIGNTSSGIKEAAALEKWYLMFPHRQENREVDGNVIVVQTLDDVIKAYESMPGLNQTPFEYRGLFGDQTVTESVIQYIKELLG
jgi:UDP-hydrolysing UDP-N-acetyl-D-glucosamine 2-epimerase